MGTSITACVRLGDEIMPEEVHTKPRYSISVSMKVEPYRIDIAEGEDIRKQWARHFSPPINNEIDRQVDELLKEGFIRESKSPVAFPVVPVRKPDGSLRVCIDYKPLNKWTLDVRYPLPLLKDCISRFANKKYLSRASTTGARGQYISYCLGL